MLGYSPTGLLFSVNFVDFLFYTIDTLFGLAVAGGLWQAVSGEQKYSENAFFARAHGIAARCTSKYSAKLILSENFYGKLNELVYLDMVFGFLYGRIIRMLKKSINIALNNMTVECINH